MTEAKLDPRILATAKDFKVRARDGHIELCRVIDDGEGKTQLEEWCDIEEEVVRALLEVAHARLMSTHPACPYEYTWSVSDTQTVSGAEGNSRARLVAYPAISGKAF